MGDRALDRIFAQAAAAVQEFQDSADPDKQLERQQVGDDELLRRMTAGMTAGDAIKRILLAEQDKDFFRMLELPQPELDALGRAAWGVAPADVSKAYRKLSILVHPDKNPGEEARMAFEALNQAHRALKDPNTLESILREQVDKARARRDEAEGRATLGERVALNAQQKEQAKELRRAEGEALHAEVVRQVRERQERAKRKKEAEGKSRYRRGGDGSGSDGEGSGDGGGGAAPQAAQPEQHGSDSEDEARRRRVAIAKRRQQQQKKLRAI